MPTSDRPDSVDLGALRDHLNRLQNDDPTRAVAEARALRPSRDVDFATRFVGASVLVNAGRDIGDLHAVKEGRRIFHRLLKERGDDPALLYNHANACVEIEALNHQAGPKHFVETMRHRRAARRDYLLVGSSGDASDRLRAQAYTNLGNALCRSGRYWEAHDQYRSALDLDPRHGMAAGNAAQCLREIARIGLGDVTRLFRLAAHYAHLAQDNRAGVLEDGGPRAWERFRGLPAQPIPDDEFELPPTTDPYHEFVLINELALSPTVYGLSPEGDRWDDLKLASVTEPASPPHGMPPVFAMFNVLKSEFLLARRLIYEGCQGEARDSGRYHGTQDYAVYGCNVSKLILGQRAAYDLLDKVAGLLNEYLAIGLAPGDVTFLDVWKSTKSAARAEAGLEVTPLLREMQCGNTAVMALMELAGDVADSGAFVRFRELRQFGTHRFVVAHEMVGDSNRECGAVRHDRLDHLERLALETLTLVRGAILYVAELVRRREARIADSFPRVMPIPVRDYDWFRGREDQDSDDRQE